MADEGYAESVAGPDDEDKDKEPKKSAKKWLADVEQAQSDFKSYSERCTKLEDLFTKKRDENISVERKYSILWSNLETLKPAVYARQPQPVVNRRFSDKDTTGRDVAEVLQRCLTSVFDLANVDACIRKVRDDFLLVGRGAAWVRYVPTMNMQEFGDEKVEVLCDEMLAFDFVHHSDFIHPKVRVWEDLPWVCRRVFLDKARFISRFGKPLYDKVKNARKSPKYSTQTKSDKNTLLTYEVWSKRDKKVIWLADGHDEILDEKPPLYDLHDFWPCPRPAYATLKTDSLVPIPDYVYYQDQAEEIDDLTKKISGLSDALKLVGFYPAGAEGEMSTAIEKALNPLTGNQMIPVPAWTAFVQGGGSGQMVQWLPVETVASTLQGCIELRKQLIDDVYQITGISDILRGQGEASETATAQNIKAQWGGVRIRDRQAELARFCRDLARIAAEIIAEKFQPETIWRMTGLTFQPAQQKTTAQMQAQFAQMQQQPVPENIRAILEEPSDEEIVKLLRDDCLRSYRVDIETDSTIEANEQQEKETRNEFLQVLGGYLEQMIPAGQQVPQLIPVLGESLMFAIRGYRAGRQLEDVVQHAVDEMTEQAKERAANPQPDPKQQLEQAKIEILKTKQQGDQQHQQAMMQFEQQKAQHEAMNANRSFELEKAKSVADHHLKVAGHNRQLLTEGQPEIEPQGPEVMQTLVQAIAQIAQGQQQQSALMAELLKTLTAPKVVDRGPDGRIVRLLTAQPATHTVQ